MVQGQKYHTLYKTTCRVTGNFYIGVHSTEDLEDGYLGSGKRLWLSIRVHGIENHEKEILEFLESREALLQREREIVNEDLLRNEKCMNLKVGGEGGLPNWSEEQLHEFHSKGGQISGPKTIQINAEKTKDRRIESMLQAKQRKYGSLNAWLGRKHSESTLEKLRNRNAQVGIKNSQFGKVWITNGSENRKIRREDLENLNGWKRGRTMQ